MKSEKVIQSNIDLGSREHMALFPKIELHRHLEGTFSMPTLFNIARRNDLDVPETLDEFKQLVQFPKDSDPDFLTFLSKFKNDWYRSLDDVQQIAHDSIRAFEEEGIVYIEVRFSPEHFCEQNDFDRREVTKLIVDAGNHAARQGGFDIKYLITFNRSKQTEAEMLDLYEQILAIDLPEIVGIDLAGDEKNYPPELFQNFFARVTKDGRFSSTIHAGEVTPPAQIWTAIKLLNADRIGHGTSAIEDAELQSYLAEHEVILEQCITSNYQTGSWVDEENHPLGALYQSGVPVTINSDDPFIQDTELTDDYIKAVSYFDFSLEDLVRLNEIAARGAFLTERERKDLLESYGSAVDAFKSANGQ
jgi:adenosine deaminase